MVIQSIASSYQTAATQRGASDGGIVDKDDFLQLLVAQLQKQDPLNPSDPSEFTSQLAQFSSLEQLIGVNDNLTGLAGLETLSSRVNAAGFIGKTVEVASSNISVSGGTASGVRFELSGDSKTTSVNVYDQGGNLVDVVSLGEQAQGSHAFTWDARGTSGAIAADGNYTFEIVAADARGQGISVGATTTGKVGSVSFDRYGNTLLEVGGATYTLADVISIGG